MKRNADVNVADADVYNVVVYRKEMTKCAMPSQNPVADSSGAGVEK